MGADLAAGVDLQALAVEHLGWVVADLHVQADPASQTVHASHLLWLLCATQCMPLLAGVRQGDKLVMLCCR